MSKIFTKEIYIVDPYLSGAGKCGAGRGKWYIWTNDGDDILYSDWTLWGNIKIYKNDKLFLTATKKKAYFLKMQSLENFLV